MSYREYNKYMIANDVIHKNEKGKERKRGKRDLQTLQIEIK